jgi:ABC-2 type transport system ATP-binding protein
MNELRKIIPQNIRVDIAKDTVDTNLLKTYGSVVETGTNTIRVFAFDSAVKELSEFAIKKNIPFTVSPITLDDVFVSLVGDGQIEHNDVNVDYDTDN